MQHHNHYPSLKISSKNGFFRLYFLIYFRTQNNFGILYKSGVGFLILKLKIDIG